MEALDAEVHRVNRYRLKKPDKVGLHTATSLVSYSTRQAPAYHPLERQCTESYQATAGRRPVTSML